VVTASGGTVASIDKWGMRKFAYPIDYKNDGFYVLMTFSSSSDLPKELERQMRISDEIVRYMVIRK
jgi:small subunit ribosomal protein S6